MNKQDRQGVRTAAELERKYDLKSIPTLKKAVRLSEEGINKTNKILEDFIVSTLGSMENMQNQIDGNITTYFYSGIPSLDTLPASEWITDELKSNHVGDLYYDQNTGYAYRFVYSDGEYVWLELADNDVAEALALANAAQDTADNKRRVFVDTPYPPYDNGDLWFYNLELYVCQISKGEKEIYEENDFILATKYTDNTLAIEVKDELQILKGTVTTIKENSDSFEVEITKETNAIRASSEKNESDIGAMDKSLQEQIEILKTYFTFAINGMTIGKSNNPNKIEISNERIGIWVDKKEILWIDANTRKIHTPAMEVETRFKALGYEEVEDTKGRINTRWVGGTNVG